MKYNILAKFLIPIDQTEVIIRDSLVSGIQFCGAYLLQRADKVCQYWNGGSNPYSLKNEREYPYVVAFEDWGNVFLKENATTVTDDQLDQRDYYRTYTHALLGFQAAVNELLMEMNATHVQNWTANYTRDHNGI